MLCLGFMTVKRQQKMKMWPWRVSPPALTGSVRRGEPENKKNMVTIQLSPENMKVVNSYKVSICNLM